MTIAIEAKALYDAVKLCDKKAIYHFGSSIIQSGGISVQLQTEGQGEEIFSFDKQQLLSCLKGLSETVQLDKNIIIDGKKRYKLDYEKIEIVPEWIIRDNQIDVDPIKLKEAISSVIGAVSKYPVNNRPGCNGVHFCSNNIVGFSGSHRLSVASLDMFVAKPFTILKEHSERICELLTDGSKVWVDERGFCLESGNITFKAPLLKSGFVEWGRIFSQLGSPDITAEVYTKELLAVLTKASCFCQQLQIAAKGDELSIGGQSFRDSIKADIDGEGSVWHVVSGLYSLVKEIKSELLILKIFPDSSPQLFETGNQCHVVTRYMR